MRDGRWSVAVLIFFVPCFLLSELANAELPSEKKMVSFFSTSKKCELAIGISNPAYAKLRSGDLSKKDGKPLMNLVLCIAELSSRPGTINEENGCGFAVYDVLRDDFNTPYHRNKFGEVWDDVKKTGGKSLPMIPGKKCAAGGFEELMKEYPGLPLGGATVLETLTQGAAYGKPEKVFLYAAEPRFKEIWEKAKDLPSNRSVKGKK